MIRQPSKGQQWSSVRRNSSDQDSGVCASYHRLFMFLLKTFFKMRAKQIKRFKMDWVIKATFNDIGIYLPSNLPTLRTFRNWCYNLQKTS